VPLTAVAAGATELVKVTGETLSLSEGLVEVRLRNAEHGVLAGALHELDALGGALDERLLGAVLAGAVVLTPGDWSE
jgi:hypothetical protein